MNDTPKMWASLEFPTKYLTDEVQQTIDWQQELHKTTFVIRKSHGLITIEAESIPFGKFERLEALLIARDIPFDRIGEGNNYTDGERRVYRPATGSRPAQSRTVYLTATDGAVYVETLDIRRCLDEAYDYASLRKMLKTLLEEVDPEISFLSDYV